MLRDSIFSIMLDLSTFSTSLRFISDSQQHILRHSVRLHEAKTGERKGNGRETRGLGPIDYNDQ
jgi:hypothetical protein